MIADTAAFFKPFFQEFTQDSQQLDAFQMLESDRRTGNRGIRFAGASAHIEWEAGEPAVTVSRGVL
ncbi:hypothetical protein, partial [Klebsiella pneumoniae]|uniref:hypothetical protein n=1 Tax=Klebsiella pneumoniae TaxID=573 RepID=UPI00301332C6